LPTKLSRAVVIRSGRSTLMASIFWNGIYSSFFQSWGSFSSSGVNSLYQSLKRAGQSTAKVWANCSKPSISISFWIDYQARSGSHSLRGLGTSFLVGALRRKYISFSVYSTLIIFFCIKRKQSYVLKIGLCFSKRPRDTHW